jgi:hypothetical protein
MTHAYRQREHTKEIQNDSKKNFFCSIFEILGGEFLWGETLISPMRHPHCKDRSCAVYLPATGA